MGTLIGATLRVLDISESTDNSDASGRNTVLAVLTAVAGMELEVARDRIRESVFKRRSSSTRRGGRRKTFTEHQIRNALQLIESGEPPSQVARHLGMSRTTLYRRINDIQP
ncbi:helix-turn-helix domain-containing protein [Cryobacterium zhongshanensis]|uniref:Helix-turn-helix domain-containing protein n=1 Tax=Cryobacterium zhongshanensis TaxID=2928153 RepID=A0AA41UMN8_9MICO|nr:helix-turn-helix domain-containing protein [Cryobacterium zhongshanensis]MCI4660021.1 helix-turn-helix domain-containing protein [Cryobacterium zhongshanensis]